MTTETAEKVEPTARVVTVGGVKWGTMLEWTNLFRGFRLATNPAKLMLAVLAIFLLYGTGRLFDVIWGPVAAKNEIREFSMAKTSADFATWQIDQEKKEKGDAVGLLMKASGKVLTKEDQQYFADHPRAAYRETRRWLIENY